ncbi:MAG: 23S rRNA (adenine(2503)-C(2))-methyltransferase RlmN [Lachnospiraceae bacterium]|nr:23S rRNA (adenine(2503)-C(2))-methyltransferase RlmN [Lachnospiraceae bacterium]
MKDRDILSMNLTELQEEIDRIGEKKYRAGQIYEWLHVKNAVSYQEMTNLPVSFRSFMEGAFPIRGCEQETMQESCLDGTRKYLFRLYDGVYIESVFMRYHHGNTVCISSQAGCRMGCAFCASAIGGLLRNLSAGEMLSQVYRIEKDTGLCVSNVVVMGTGEPLDNYDNLLRFIRMLTDKDGHHISARHVTVSTCGIVPGIRRLKEEDLEINLALSLHAPNDEIRKTIMPAARMYSLEEVFSALRFYYEKNRRRLTFEYSLISGKNDSPECAAELAERLRGFNCLVNLIPVNPVRERSFKAPDTFFVQEFKKLLEKNGIHVTIRREMGRDIDGACGQLRKRYLEDGKI